MITTKVAGLTLQFENRDDFANWIRKLATKELNASLQNKTIKEQRFHQGKYNALVSVADLIANSDI